VSENKRAVANLFAGIETFSQLEPSYNWCPLRERTTEKTLRIKYMKSFRTSVLYRHSGPAASIALMLMLSGAALAGPASVLEAPGVSNFHQVNEHLYRGAQPTNEGIQSLAHLGVKTVLDLRGGGERAREEEALVKAAGMQYVSIPFKGFGAPSLPNLIKVLALINNPAAGPVFVHCKRGADRTGTVVACYRISHDNWANEKALAEAKLLGMAWIERAMQHYVLAYKNAGAPLLSASSDQNKGGSTTAATTNAAPGNEPAKAGALLSTAN